MKRILSVVLALVMLLSLMPTGAFTLTANAATSGYYTYEVTDGEATVTDVNTSISGAVTIPTTLGGYPVTSIRFGAFEYCSRLTTVTIPDGVTSIESWAFQYCTRLTSVTIPDSVTSIADYAFSDCTSLTSITIPDSVTSIADYAFSDCTSLTSVTIGDSVTSIGDSAFSRCSSLTSITIPDSVTSIGDSAFFCSSLTSITIPDSVTSIGDDAFLGCYSLMNITVEDNNPSYCSVDGVLFTKDKTVLIQYPCRKPVSQYTIPQGVTDIREEAFFHCTNLTEVTISDSVTSIGDNAFRSCYHLKSFAVDSNNIAYCSIEGVLFNEGKTTLVKYPCGKSASQYTIPESVVSIEEDAFASCSRLISVTIPYGVTHIEDSAFFSCTSLATATLPDSVTYIGESAFCWCSSLTMGTIPDSVTSIGYAAFYQTKDYNCVSNWENGVLYIGNHLIETKTSISGVCTIRDGVKTIPYQAFFGRENLTAVIIPNSVTSIGCQAFYGCSKLASVTISDSVTSIGRDAFRGAPISWINSDNWENGVLYIGNYLIEAKESLSGAYDVKDGTKAIADEAFYGCTDLITIALPSSITSIGDSAFCGCSDLTRVTYAGTCAQAEKLNIGNDNTALKNTVWTCANAEPSDHVYDNACDADCNICGEERVIPGDVNGDGEINNKDFGMIQRYINRWDVGIDVSVSDVNDDGVVNNKDLGLLQRYINGWDVELK